MGAPPDNVLTVDVEDWYHDAGGGLAVAPAETRVERNLGRLLDLFDEVGARATLFVLGEVARANPALVREARSRGHEIASHGQRHRSARAITRREFRAELAESHALLSDLVGAPIAGFRAPYFSLKAGVRWPLEAVAEAGYRYDSSVLPIDRPPGLEIVTPLVPHLVADGLWEVPIAVNRWGLWNLPMLGGFGLRALPYGFARRRLREFNREHGPAVVHLHPWEIDAEGPEPPEVPTMIRSLKRWGRATLEGKLRRLLREHRFRPIADVFPHVLDQRSASASLAARTPTPALQR